MTTRTLVALLLAACGGTTDDTSFESDAPDAPYAPETTTASTAPADAGTHEPEPEPEPEFPLCPGSIGPDEEPDHCQTLVYRLDSGYCHMWTPCSDLGR